MYFAYEFVFFAEKRNTARALNHKLIYKIPSPENHIVQYIHNSQQQAI